MASHPPLTIQGNLILNGNPITVNGPVLAPGVYTMIRQVTGNVTSPRGCFAVPEPRSARAQLRRFQSISGGNVDLGIVAYAPTFSNLAANQSIIYGATNVTLGGILSAVGPTYPANGETVTVTINGNAQTTTINDATGDFSINYNPATLPVSSSSPYPITYSYAGDAALNAASDATKTLTVNNRPVILTGTRVFDGTATVAASILSVSNVVGGDIVTVASGSGTLAATNVGPEADQSVPAQLALGAICGRKLHARRVQAAWSRSRRYRPSPSPPELRRMQAAPPCHHLQSAPRHDLSSARQQRRDALPEQLDKPRQPDHRHRYFNLRHQPDDLLHAVLQRKDAVKEVSFRSKSGSTSLLLIRGGEVAGVIDLRGVFVGFHDLSAISIGD